MTIAQTDEAGDFNDWFHHQEVNVSRFWKKAGHSPVPISAHLIWYVAPYVTLWSVKDSVSNQKWWVITGDLDSDGLPAKGYSPRAAVKEFGRRLKEKIDKKGASPPFQMTETQRNKAEALLEWVADDDLWPEELLDLIPD